MTTTPIREAGSPADAADILGWPVTPASPDAHPAPPSGTGIASFTADPVTGDSDGAALMRAAYSVLAFNQPLMTSNLKPGPTWAPKPGRPASTSRVGHVLAELAELDGL